MRTSFRSRLRQNWKLWLLIAILALILYWAFVFVFGGGDMKKLTLVDEKGESHTVWAEIADTPEERQVGLMDRTYLPENTGMLFVFEKELVVYFWMKNTLIPLDIVFFQADGQYVSSTPMVPCEKDPCPSYHSLNPSMYALELPKDFVKTNGVKKGWRLHIPDLVR